MTWIAVIACVFWAISIDQVYSEKEKTKGFIVILAGFLVICLCAWMLDKMTT